MSLQFNYNREATNAYLSKVAIESSFTELHKGFTIVPHKIIRCYGLTAYEKLILIDLWGYMGDKNHCFPSLETIARNISSSSKTVERHIHSLADKNLILISKSKKNHTYYLPSNLHKNPYLLMSESTHEFIREVRNTVNDCKLSKWVKEMVKSEVYSSYVNELTRLMKHEFTWDNGDSEKSCLSNYTQFLKEQYNTKFMKPGDLSK